ncbi:hypothetical protein [Sinorhizobium meliloti]|uniref:hypothetical protein n=1 Tax=Rhizobium meliloti TaxID=382 RepID=UPI000FDC740F|nr:hypothetical protein [Sinorhizobium meliloti]RVM99751.1 hypothetical protein CN115_34565 [Sinorhizobium meliloti]RVN13774.1 hypothetical protein CN114_34515 [Sinorhizobium meliloti]RVN30103.1 hypothetical protein CN111_34775 [Sinorhizobium meliloti]RVN98101.1 hypothetical protein CN099_34545 [Sinorhizobium meliloti]RVQ09164.1 hypothetical protein CN067_34770 [Sinorhizobium meliloti]
MTSTGLLAYKTFLSTLAVLVFGFPQILWSQTLTQRQSPIQQILKAFGELEVMEGDGAGGGIHRPGCTVVALTSRLVLGDECAYRKNLDMENAILQTTILNTEGKPATLKAVHWTTEATIFTVKGAPIAGSSRVRLSREHPRLGDRVIVIAGTSEPPQIDCEITDLNDEFGYDDFMYDCANWTIANQERGQLIFSLKDYSLIGVRVGFKYKGLENGRYPARWARSYRDNSDSVNKAAAVADPPPPSEDYHSKKIPWYPYEIEGKLLHNLSCERVYKAVKDQDVYSKLSVGALKTVAMYIRACAASIDNNIDEHNRSIFIIVLRSIGMDLQKPTKFAIDTIYEKDTEKIIHLCWRSGGTDRDYINRNLSRGQNGEIELGKYAFAACMETTYKNHGEPVFLLGPMQEGLKTSLREMLGKKGLIQYADDVINPWELTQVAAPQGAPTQNGPVTIGPIDKRCLASWDDPPHLHSQQWIFRWDYQAVKTRMKKLRHCYELTVTGPVNVKDVAKDFVNKCINDALNDNKAIHIFKGLLGLSVDVLSAGTTGGSATLAAVTDYLVAVQDRAISCFTNSDKIDQLLTDKLQESFDASVRHEMHWIYWDL